MKKTSILVLFLVVIIISGSIYGYYYFSNQPKSKDSDGDSDDDGYTPLSKPRVNMYVNSSIYSSIYTDVQKYKQNASNQGFIVNVINWSDTSVKNLKLNITYTNYNTSLSGVILIGQLPYAMGRYWDTIWGKAFDFPTDIYLMDLDGNWTDIDGDSVYNIDPVIGLEHTNGTGDWGPEIWLARIDPYSISDSTIHLDSLKDFFKRTREIRNGTITRPHKAMLYIDDTWSYLDWESHFTAYTAAQRDTYKVNSLTNAINYMNNLTLNSYELVHLWVHSYTDKHQWGGGSEGYTTFNDISTNNTVPLFYMMYACSIYNHTVADNIATHYLFTGGSTLTVVASARTGGVDLYKPFYDALKQGKTFGEGFYTWLQNPEIETLNKEPLYYGMTILGDPLATIYMT